MNRRLPLLALLVLALVRPATADLGEPPRQVLEVEGALLVGTYPAAVGTLDDGEPVPGIGIGPVSRASWGFNTTACHIYVHVVMAYRSLPDEGNLSEEALLRVRLLDTNGTLLADWFATGGRLERAYDPPLAVNATHTIEVHHMVGPRVEYDLSAWLYHACPF